MKTLQIKKWKETFENADSRKRQRLGFYYMPSGCDSAGYLALMSEFEPAEAWQAYGTFVALCQHAATMRRDVRGMFINSNGTPMTTRQIAMLIRCDHDLLLRSLELLCDERVGWISADDVPPICQSSATSVPLFSENSSIVQGQGQGQGQGEGQVKEVAALPFDSEEFKDTWSEWLTYLKQKRKTPTKITITKQHKQLSKLTETDAINTINKSIQNGWQGLFPDEQRNGKHSSHSGQANRSSAGHSTGAGDGINVPIL